jgi:hypothetical protein
MATSPQPARRPRIRGRAGHMAALQSRYQIPDCSRRTTLDLVGPSYEVSLLQWKANLGRC